MSEPSVPPDYARLLAGQASLAGRAAFVPGGYGGIGAAIAWGLALAGARVAGRFGSLDLLVNCVGIQREERHAEVSEAAFDEVVQVNLKAAMFMSQAAAPTPP